MANKLLLLFPVTETVEDLDRKERLRSLETWVTQTTKILFNNAAAHYTDRAHNILSFRIGIDTKDFSTNELAGVSAHIKDLHDLCRDRNIDLNIAGFDRPSHAGVSTDRGWHEAPCVVIEVNTGKKYRLNSHPEYESPIKAKSRDIPVHKI